jgi:hypothetical protein
VKRVVLGDFERRLVRLQCMTSGLGKGDRLVIYICAVVEVSSNASSLLQLQLHMEMSGEKDSGMKDSWWKQFVQ